MGCKQIKYFQTSSTVAWQMFFVVNHQQKHVFSEISNSFVLPLLKSCPSVVVPSSVLYNMLTVLMTSFKRATDTLMYHNRKSTGVVDKIIMAVFRGGVAGFGSVHAVTLS